MLPFSIMTFWSLTQALSTLRRVLVARSTAKLTASSKLCSEVALNSVTRATVILPSFVLLSLKDLLPLRWSCKRTEHTRLVRREEGGLRIRWVHRELGVSGPT